MAEDRDPVRVLIVDDHPLMRTGLAAVLAQQARLTVVGEAGDGAEAIEAHERLRPDVTLMDVQMPGLDGIEATQAILAAHPQARILMLTTYQGDVRAMRALKAGARGYMLKSAIRKELVEAIHAVHDGQRHIPPDVAAELALHALDPVLSPRELEVLRAAAGGSANKTIADQLRLSEETVKTHMKNVLAKLSARDRTQAVVIALRRGLIQLGS
jgi:DNA-binding NarL/FixJ family response regulator